jgi:hypothetical protein
MFPAALPISGPIAPLARHPASFAFVFAAVAVMAGLLTLSRPGHKSAAASVQLPSKQPANDAPGAAGWVWADGTPGWEAGATVHGIDVSGLQPVEIQAAQLSAARYGLDASHVRVVSSVRPDRRGVLAILAAPTLNRTPEQTCLSALPQSDAPPAWNCAGETRGPEDLSQARVLVAASAVTGPAGTGRDSIFLAGVARGDVARVVLDAPGLPAQTLYTRGKTWGQFTAAATVPLAASRLLVYGRSGLVQTLALNVAPGTQRVLR